MASTTLERPAPREQAPAPGRFSLPSFGGWLQRLPQIDLLTTLPLLTVVLLLTGAPDFWYIRTPLIIACVLALVFRNWLSSTAYWFCLSVMVGATVYLNWESCDNHKYLMVYWCMALACTFSLDVRDQQHGLALSARWLIGLCMLLAVLWKLFTPNYIDGEFFRHQLTVDARFEHFTRALTGLTAAELAENRHRHSELVNGHLHNRPTESAAFHSNAAVDRLSATMTWWTIGIEAVIALLFLAPDNRHTARWRNFVLLLFAATTYAVATVRVFGWVLMLLGMAQTNDRERGPRLAYLGMLLLIQAYTLPFGAIYDAMGR